MAHLVHFKAGGIWLDLDVPGGAAFTYLDQTLAKCVNGDDGGVWAPTSALEFGGAGLKISGNGNFWSPTSPIEIAGQGLRLTGGVAHRVRGADTVLRTEAGGRLELGDNDYPVFAARPRTIRMPAATSVSNTGNSGQFLPLGSVLQLSSSTWSAGEFLRAVWNLNAFLHDGATLSAIVVYFTAQVSNPPDALPAMPMLRAIRHELAPGSVPDNLGVGLAAAPNVFPSPGSVAAWRDGGRIKAWNYPLTQNNVINRGAYNYQLELEWDPFLTGGMSLSIYGIDLKLTNIRDLRFP